MELLGAVRSHVVAPNLAAGVRVEGEEMTRARTDEEGVPRDRGGAEDSPARVDLPENLEGVGRRVGDQHLGVRLTEC